MTSGPGERLRELSAALRRRRAPEVIEQPAPAPGAAGATAWRATVAEARARADAHALAHREALDRTAQELFGQSARDLLGPEPEPVLREEIRMAVPADAQLGDLVPGLDGIAPRGPGRRGGGSEESVRIVIARPIRPRGGVVIRLHGGAFWMGGGAVMDTIDAALVDRLAVACGATVLDVDYRLAPENPHPAGIVDVLSVLDAVRASVVVAGADPSRIALVGTSSGSTIAAVAAMADALRDRPAPVAALGLIAPSMLLGRAPDPVRRDAAAREVRRRQIRGYLGDDADPSSPWISPGAARALSGMPPTFCAIAAHDEIAMGGQDLVRAIAAGGGEATAVEYDMFHTVAPPEVEAAMIGDVVSFVAAEIAEKPGGSA